MKVSVDPERCQGHGRCYTLSPRIFEDDVEGYGQVTSSTVSDPELFDDVRRAANACPEGAILVRDEAAPQH